MRPHQCLPLLSVFVLMLSTKRASSSTTLSCFSVGLLDLPTFGFNQEKQEEAEAKSEVTKWLSLEVKLVTAQAQAEEEGRQVSSSFDACFWGLLR